MMIMIMVRSAYILRMPSWRRKREGVSFSPVSNFSSLARVWYGI